MKFLIDSDFLIAVFLTSEPLHEVATKLLSEIDEGDEICVTSLVEMESATVMSNKKGMKSAVEFRNWIMNLGMRRIFIDEIHMILGWKMFLEQTKKGSSFIDSMNLVVAKKLGCKKILSFDKFYPKELRA